MTIIKKFLILALVLLCNVAAAEEIIDDDELGYADEYDEEHRSMYMKPLWWDTLKASYEGNDLRRCFKRQDRPPTTGKKCSQKVKTCFFETQLCAGDVSFPNTLCHCDGKEGTQKWVCEDAACPINLSPTKDVTIDPPPVVIDPVPITPLVPTVDPMGCPLEGLDFEVLNDESCPATFNDVGSTCTAGQESLTCNYGKETWCVLNLWAIAILLICMLTDRLTLSLICFACSSSHF
jgi:hypothetical protein